MSFLRDFCLYLETGFEERRDCVRVVNKEGHLGAVGLCPYDTYSNLYGTRGHNLLNLVPVPGTLLGTQ